MMANVLPCAIAADLPGLHFDLGVVLPRNFTVVVSRLALVPRVAGRRDLGTDSLRFLMGRQGQTLLADRLRLPAVSLQVAGLNNFRAMAAALCDQLRPVPVSPGPMAWLDQCTRAQIINR